MRHLQIWHQEGIARAHFAPSVTYPGQADKHIPNQASNHTDGEGNYYYTSYPPLAYYVPYAVFEMLRLDPAVWPLRVFNLVLHFMSGIFVCLSLKVLLHREQEFSVPAIFGFVVYIFSPQTLWLQANVYMSDIFVQVLFTAGIYFVLKWAAHGPQGPLSFVILTLLTFCMTYSEWLGLTFALSLVIYGWLSRKESWSGRFQLAAALGAGAALILTIWQYSLISGLHAFLISSQQKFLLRSGLGVQPELRLHPWGLLGWLFIAAYLGVAYGADFLAISFWALLASRNMIWNVAPKLKSALICSAVLPPVLHHIIFFNYTAVHEFSTLKDAPILSILAGIAAWRVWNGTVVAPRPLVRRTALVLSLPLFCVVAVAQYRLLTGPTTRGYEAIGTYIANNSAPDEVIFAQYSQPSTVALPQVVFYARRNIAPWQDEQHARELVRQNGLSRAVVFAINSTDTQVIAVRHFSF